VATAWPAGAVGTRLAPQMLQAQQHWRISPAPQGGGYPGSPYFRISIAGTERTLSATADGELTVLPAFNGAPEQLWRVDQLTDGTYRVMPKSVAGWASPPALSAVGSSSPTLSAFRPDSDRYRWIIKAP
jgi:arabinan endo-1,5-alpha-L-arabinosidase